MVSKIFFLIALILAICWMFVFLLFSTYFAVHIIAIMAVLLLGASYVTRNNEY